MMKMLTVVANWDFVHSIDAWLSKVGAYLTAPISVSARLVCVGLLLAWSLLFAHGDPFDGVVKKKEGRDTERYFVDSDTGEVFRYQVPFLISSFAWRTHSEWTEFWIETSNEVEWSHLVEAVFTVEIHCGGKVVAYANNFEYPGLEPRVLGVVDYHTGQLVSVGEICFDETFIYIKVPLRLNPEVLLYRYLPSVDARKRAGGLLGAVADYAVVKRPPRGNLPGFPQRYAFQRQRGPERWRGEEIPVPTGDNDRPRLGERVRNENIWPRDISLFPDEYGVDLGNGKLVEWGLEQGTFPYGGYDGSDAWVGIVGTDRNGNGKLEPDEVEGVIGRCPANGYDNKFIVDEKGIVHWYNYLDEDRDGDGELDLNLHYIYDPARDLLKIFRADGTLIYMGPPRNWRR